MARTFQLWVTVTGWYDGDTFYGVLDQSCRTYMGRTEEPLRFRCAIIDAPELRDAGGLEALAYARELVPPGEYECTSVKLDSFGRPMIDLHLTPGGRRFSEAMLSAGHAVVYNR